MFLLNENRAKQYSDFFMLDEFRQSPRLKLIACLLLLSFVDVLSFLTDYGIAAIRENISSGVLCWPYYQGCKQLHVLALPPSGYSYHVLFILLSFVTALSGFFVARGRYLEFHLSAAFLIACEFFFLFIWSMDAVANYHYYHFVLFFFLLFATPRLLSLRIVFVFMYFLAGQVKLHSGWVLGTYFTTLKSGMLFVPDSLAPLLCAGVILLELVGSWFLLSNNIKARWSIIGLYVVFHLYSSIYVGFRYPVSVMPILLILFANREIFDFSFVAIIKNKVGWCAMFIGLLMQLVGDVIPGDEKLTLEGHAFGLYMFDANHQCRSSIAVYRNTGAVERVSWDSNRSRSRCDPFRGLQKIKSICSSSPGIQRVEWIFDHSINGEPFYRIVDVSDACKLEYKAFSRNPWIHLPEEGARNVGYPLTNCINCS